MGLNLSKGQSLSLGKADGGSLTKLRMGLGWDSVASDETSDRGGQAPVDLDASAIFFDAAGRVLDTVWFQQLQSKDGSTVHTGDNLTGAGDGDDETILVDLTAVAPAVSQIVFVISSYSEQTFDLVENAFSRLVDDSVADTPEVARYQLTDAGSHTAMIMSKVSRDGTGWTFKAVGERANGRSVMDLLTPAAQVL
ncbi:TerD family protein [soil metagenome]